MSTRTRTAALALAAAAPFLLVACGDDGAESAADIPESADFNAADVEFATQMIPHHAQALEMVEMAEGRDLSPEVADLVERIGAAQAPEIEQMAAWLEEWDQPVPETDGMAMDHGDMDHGDMDHGSDGAMDMGDEMPGMTQPNPTSASYATRTTTDTTTHSPNHRPPRSTGRRSSSWTERSTGMSDSTTVYAAGT